MARLSKRKSIGAALVGLVIVLGQQLGWFKPPQPNKPLIQPGQYQVVKVYDGDTIAVNMNGKEEKVRLIGVDTPETHDPRKPVECFGEAAANFTHSLLDNQAVRLESDPLSTNRDRYSRLLRYVYLPDGRLVDQEIIAAGYGFAYTSFPFTKIDDFRAAEKAAKEANKGLWSSCPVTVDSQGHIHSQSD